MGLSRATEAALPSEVRGAAVWCQARATEICHQPSTGQPCTTEIDTEFLRDHQYVHGTVMLHK